MFSSISFSSREHSLSVVQNREDPAISTLPEHQRTVEEQRCLLDEVTQLHRFSSVTIFGSDTFLLLETFRQSFVSQLARIEQDLKESIRREELRQRELDLVRREENRIRWRSLSFLSLNQRTTKYEPPKKRCQSSFKKKCLLTFISLFHVRPWVTSYYKNIPMHIYCLPIETVAHKQQNKKWIKR